METMFGFAALALGTILSLFAALALQSLLLRATLALMHSAAADRRRLPPQIERGGGMAARAYAKSH